MSQESLQLKTPRISEILSGTRFVYPRPLPPVNIQGEPDENGLSKMDKATLRQAWRLIMPFQVRFSRRSFYNYLIANEKLINKFRNPQGQIMLGALHNHGRKMMHLFDQIINNYLDKPNELHTKLDESMPKHLDYEVFSDTLLDFTESLKTYLLSTEQWSSQKTERLEIAVDRLFNFVATFNMQQELRRKTTTWKYTMAQRVTMRSRSK